MVLKPVLGNSPSAPGLQFLFPGSSKPELCLRLHSPQPLLLLLLSLPGQLLNQLIGCFFRYVLFASQPVDHSLVTDAALASAFTLLGFLLPAQPTLLTVDKKRPL